MPKGALSKSTAFSSAWCGAWSVAIASIVPSERPATSASRSESSRSGGFIFVRVEKSDFATSSSVRTRWCGVTSQVTPDAGGLRAPHHVEGKRRREVRHVQASARHLGHQQVARHRGRLRHGRLAREAEARGDRALVHRRALREAPVLGVLDDRQVEQPRVLEGVAQLAAVCQPLPVVGEGDRAGLAQLAEGRHHLALLTLRDGADRIEPRAAGDLAPQAQELAGLAAVVDRVRVGHRADGGEAARGRRGEPRRDRLGVLAPGLAQVRVQVDEAGQDQKARGVEHLGVAGLDAVADLDDAAVGEQHVEAAVLPGRRIDELAAADQELAAHARPPRGARRAAGTGPPCARRRRWRPGRG